MFWYSLRHFTIVHLSKANEHMHVYWKKCSNNWVMIACVSIISIIFLFKPTQGRECWWKSIQTEIIACLLVYLEMLRKNMIKGIKANAQEYRTHLICDKTSCLCVLTTHNRAFLSHYIFDPLHTQCSIQMLCYRIVHLKPVSPQ